VCFRCRALCTNKFCPAFRSLLILELSLNSLHTGQQPTATPAGRWIAQWANAGQWLSPRVLHARAWSKGREYITSCKVLHEVSVAHHQWRSQHHAGVLNNYDSPPTVRTTSTVASGRFSGVSLLYHSGCPPWDETFGYTDWRDALQRWLPKPSTFSFFIKRLQAPLKVPATTWSALLETGEPTHASLSPDWNISCQAFLHKHHSLLVM
jgi:hypothetical protein